MSRLSASLAAEMGKLGQTMGILPLGMKSAIALAMIRLKSFTALCERRGLGGETSDSFFRCLSVGCTEIDVGFPF